MYALRAIGRPEAPDVHLPEVQLGLPVHDPRRHLAADAAGTRDPVRREAGGHEEPAHLGLAEDELVVGGERLRPVDDPAHAGVGHRRDPPDGALHDRLEAGHVGREELAIEVSRDPVERPRRRVALVAAHAQAADLLAEVDEVVRVAQLGQSRVHALDRLGEQVLVRHRDDRDGHPGHPADLRGEHPAGIDDDLRADLVALALVLDGHPGDAASIHADRDHPRVGPDRRAARPRAGGQRLGEPGRVEPAVRRQVDRPQDAIGRHQREEIARLRGRDQLERQPERLRPAGLPTQLLEPLGGRRQPERSHLVPGRVHAGLGGEAAVQGRPVHHHPGQRDRAPELPDQAGGVERRAGGQLRPIDEHDIGPAELGEVVGDGGAAHAAADDDRPGMLDHRVVSPPPTPCRHTA